MDELIRLRQELHRHPELSGSENTTGKRVRFYLNKYRPDEMHTHLAGEGMIAIFRGSDPGPTLLFRCELDALPIEEKNDLTYSSTIQGVSHACGHDGHIAIVSGLAARLTHNAPKRGRVILLYQPEEETGRGAEAMTGLLKEMNLSPDYAFATHNMPGYPLGSVILSKSTFCCASKGITISLTGVAAHAATPEHGINPSLAIARIVEELNSLQISNALSSTVQVTVVSIRVGEAAFGTSPGKGELCITLRAETINDMENLTKSCEELTRRIAMEHNLVMELTYSDSFPPLTNSKELSKTLHHIAQAQSRKAFVLDRPNPWSEDFAHFTNNGAAILFGLGVGETIPMLHSPSYNFPDNAIEHGVDILDACIDHYLR